MQTIPVRGVVRSREPYNLAGTNHIYGTAEARVLKFCTLVGYVNSQQTDDKLPLKGARSCHVTHFKFLGPQ